MNEPTKSGTPPSVEGIVSRLSPFSVDETLERLQEAIQQKTNDYYTNGLETARSDRSGGDAAQCDYQR